MENTLSTREEIERRKELFEYEMTEVILKLKGKFAKFDREQSPLRDSGLTNSDFICKPEFVPLPIVEVESGKFTVPVVNPQPEFAPLPIVEVKSGKFTVPAVSPQPEFAPLPIVEVKSGKFTVPAVNPQPEFAPLPIVEVESGKFTVPAVSKQAKYKPFNVTISGASVNVPVTLSAVDYSPMVDKKPIKSGFKVPAIPRSMDYIAFKGATPKSSVKAVPHLGEVPAFKPTAVTGISRAECSLPDAVGDIGYTPFKNKSDKAMKIDVPAFSSISEYSSFDAPEITGVIADAPTGRPEFSFAPYKKTDAIQTCIEHPVTAIIADYVPRKKTAVVITTKAVPKSKVKVAFSPLKANGLTADISKIRYKKESIQSKDFYSMWAAM